MKGIILAGGFGTRLYPITIPVVKQLLPIYDKPMIYYPLSTLMLAGIRDILIISTPSDIDRFRSLFSDGSSYGLRIEYAVQDYPRGLADAFIVGREFIGDEDVALVLGDNIFYGHGLTDLLEDSRRYVESQKNAVIFAYAVKNPSAYGVVEFDGDGRPVSIIEKPDSPNSNWAVVGLYFYPNDVVEVVKGISPSERGELEISAVNDFYLRDGRLDVRLLGRGYAWLDTGTFENLLEAGKFIEIIEKRQGWKIACIEEIAYKNGFISKEQLLELARPLMKSSYGEYLLSLIEED